jgi:hypothetical protein
MRHATATLLLLLTSSVDGFAPSSSFTRRSSTQQQHHPTQSKRQHQTQLTLLPIDSSSLLTSSDWVDGLISNLGALALIGSVGAGVYTSALAEMEKNGMGVFDGEGTSDDVGEVEERSAPVLFEDVVAVVDSGATVSEEAVVVEEVEVVEEMGDVVGEVLAVQAAPAKAIPTSETVLKATDKAIAEVKAKGVRETKEKLKPKEQQQSASAVVAEDAKETKKEEVAVESTKRSSGTKRKIAQGVALTVAAVGVAVARNVVKAWLGRGML